MSTEVKNKIREIRKAQGHTLETLSEMMGVSQSSIEKVEKGQRRLKQYFLVRAAEALRVDPHELANGQEIDQEARISSVINKPGANDPNIFTNRSIQLFKSSGLGIPKEQTASFVACPSTIWDDPSAFAVTIPVVPDNLEEVAPWLGAGTVCFCSSKAPLSKGGLVVADRGDNYSISQIEGFSDSTIKCKPWVGESFEVDPSAVYPIVTINLK